MPVTCGFTWFVSGTQACSRSSCALAASKAPPTPPSLLPYIGWPASTTMAQRKLLSATSLLFWHLSGKFTYCKLLWKIASAKCKRVWCRLNCCDFLKINHKNTKECFKKKCFERLLICVLSHHSTDTVNRHCGHKLIWPPSASKRQLCVCFKESNSCYSVSPLWFCWLVELWAGLEFFSLTEYEFESRTWFIYFHFSFQRVP